MTSPQDPNGPERPESPGESQIDPPPAPAPAPPGAEGGARRLTRSTGDRVLGGVAGGLGRYFGIDPIIFRVVFVVLLFAGAVGALAYVALWLLVPDDSPGAEPPAGNSRAGLVAAGAILVVLALVLSGGPLFWFFGPGLLLLALIIAGVVAIVLDARGEGGDATKVLVRTMIVLGSLVAALVLALVGGLIAAAGGGVAVAAVLIGAGLFLVVGAFTGGARWLIVPALALAASAAFVAAADIELDGGIGEQRYRPVTVSDIRDRYELGIGELVVDLRDVDFPAGATRVDLKVGMGQARVIVPSDVCAGLIAEMGAGRAELHGTGSGGIDVDWREIPRAPTGVPRVLIGADLGVGEVVVDDERFLDHDGRRFGPVFGRQDVFGGGPGNERCLP